MTADAGLSVEGGQAPRGDPGGQGGARRAADAAAAEADALLAACGAGDRQAFAALYGVAAPRLFGLALRMLKRRELAEEALQECFIEIWRQAARFDRARGAAMSWMVAVLRHKALDVLRRVRPTGAAPDDQGAETADDAPGAFDLVARTEEAARVVGCLGSLEEGPRRSITLAYYDGLTHEEISRRMAAPLGTVKSWVRRGLLQLRSCLAAEGAGG